MPEAIAEGDGGPLRWVMIALIVGAIGLSMLSGGVFSSGSQGPQFDDVPITAGDGTIDTEFYQSVDGITSVETSLGDQAALNGADDATVTVQASMGLGDEWSVCTWSEAAQSTVDNNESRALFGLNGQLVLTYNGTNDVWRAWYYNESSTQTYATTVAAPDPTTRRLVCGLYNGSHLRVSRNTTVGAPVEIAGENHARDPATANWNGSLEETRVYPANLSGSDLQEWVGEPQLAIAGQAPATRVMYDVRSRSGVSSVPAYFSGSDAELGANASLEDGFAGPSVSQGSDYSVSGDTISIVGGGSLDDSGEVLFVTFEVAGGLARYLIVIGVAIALLTPLALGVLRLVNEM